MVMQCTSTYVTITKLTNKGTKLVVLLSKGVLLSVAEFGIFAKFLNFYLLK